MNGRDLPAFITSSRSEDLEKLTLRMKDGLGSSKYKPAEYDKLKAIVEAKRLESEHIEKKVQKTLYAAKATRESALLRQHRRVWSREYSRLAQAEESAENDLQAFLGQIRPSRTTDTGIFPLLDCGPVLEKEREAFRSSTVEPVWRLKEDLCFRLKEMQRLPRALDWELVLQQVNFVKDQQRDIVDKLHTEYQTLEEDTAALGIEEYLTKSPDCHGGVEQQVPEEVLQSECPYPGLKDNLILAFRCLSEKYQSRLQALQEKSQAMDGFGGWCADDHLRFQMTVGQYPQDQPNRRALYMDMLQRLFPYRSRQELTEHEGRWDWQRFTQVQLALLAQSWHRDQAELLAQALLTLEEASYAHQEELDLHRDRQHQQDICSSLRDKLQQWRLHQEEVSRLEAAIASRRQEAEEERLRREQEKEAALRSQQKEKVRQFYAKQQRRRGELERRDQERLAQLRSLMADQARRDKERARFREQALQQRKEQREAQALQRLREEEDKQSRLEALRNQVAVVAEVDPERMMGETEAWRNRQRIEEEGEFVLRKPLYHLNTYTDSQIVSDPRVRIEQALRQAGLHQSLYAQEVLSGIQPHRPTRRDTKSTIFKT
ncbi:coiled-coil domain-containing protein 148-like [Aplochiton taeniatus]